MWIRSQDKKDLIKTENISVVDRASSFDIETDTKDSIFTLGEYSTEEKALKVLDMVQERLEPYRIAMRFNEFHTIPKDDSVFQMPQEDEV